MMDKEDAPLVGQLHIYVDGYKVAQKNAVHLVTRDGITYAIPDVSMPAPNYERGSQAWWHNGWAVGDNARNRLCLRFGNKPLLTFNDYDEAVAFIERRQRKYKQQRHTLVYVTKGVGGQQKHDIVHFLDDILAIDATRQMEISAQHDYANQQRSRQAETHPELDRFREKFSYSKALKLAELLGCIRAGCPTAPQMRLSKSTRNRLLRELKAMGFIDADTDCCQPGG